MVMTLIKCVIFVITILVSCCYSEELRIGQRLKRDTDETFLENLSVQNEKIKSLLTMAVTDNLLPQCTSILQRKYVTVANQCWQDLITQVKIADQSTSTEMLLCQLVRDAYDGEKSRLPSIAMFITNNVEKGSEVATGAYEALLDAMAYFEQLYLIKPFVPIAQYDTSKKPLEYTFRTLIPIRDAEGESSPIFTRRLPTAVNSILSGKEVYIRNSMTRDYLYASADCTDDCDAKVLLDGVKRNNPRYLWKLKPVEARWKSDNDERFWIINSFENKALDTHSQLRKSGTIEGEYSGIWTMFYIQLVEGSSGEEVVFGLDESQYLGLNENENWKKTKSLWSHKLEEMPSIIWLLEPRE